ncbi:hypothetical protein LSAT2_010188 [Lamellibrachia satsuma]|nr:hypothetical protein LSAT2_010188 [Lamellibrachia satsuma]
MPHFLQRLHVHPSLTRLARRKQVQRISRDVTGHRKWTVKKRYDTSAVTSANTRSGVSKEVREVAGNELNNKSLLDANGPESDRVMRVDVHTSTW